MSLLRVGLYTLLATTIALQSVQYFAAQAFEDDCTDPDLTQGTNAFVIAAQYATFNACEGFPVWFSAPLTLLATVPWLFVLADFLSRFLNNAVSALIVTVLGAFTFLVGYFS